MLLCHHCYYFSDWTPDRWINFWFLIAAIGTCIATSLIAFLAIPTYKKALKENTETVKDSRSDATKLIQMQAFWELVKSIHNCYNIFHFYTKDKGAETSHWQTLIDIAESKDFNQNILFYTFCEEDESRFPQRAENIIEYQKLNEIINWDFYKFYNNPMIPKPIAKVLQKFNIANWTAKEYNEIKKTDCVIMGRKFLVDDKTRCLYYNDKLTLKEFQNNCKELKTVIEEWAKNNGIEDLNISISHHFRKD